MQPAMPCTLACMCMCMHVWRPPSSLCVRVCVCMCTRTCLHVCMRARIHMCTCLVGQEFIMVIGRRFTSTGMAHGWGSQFKPNIARQVCEAMMSIAAEGVVCLPSFGFSVMALAGRSAQSGIMAFSPTYMLDRCRVVKDEISSLGYLLELSPPFVAQTVASPKCG